MVILGKEELGLVFISTLVVIWTSFFNKDPLQINTFWFFLTTQLKITLLGSDDALKQSALDVTIIGESSQSIQVSPVHNREEVTIKAAHYMSAVGFKIIAGTDTHFIDPLNSIPSAAAAACNTIST